MNQVCPYCGKTSGWLLGHIKTHGKTGKDLITEYPEYKAKPVEKYEKQIAYINARRCK